MEGKLFLSLHKMMEKGELFVVRSLQRECDGDRSSKAAMRGGGGAQRQILQVIELKKTGARSARARTRG